MRQKNFDRKTWYPFLCINFFDITSFLKHWRDAFEFFRHWETKNFRRNVVTPLPCIKFSIAKTFCNIEVISIPYFDCISYFDYPTLSEILKRCPRIFSALWDLKLFTENVIPPNIHKNLRYHNFSKTLQECSWNFSALWDENFSTYNCDTPLFHP